MSAIARVDWEKIIDIKTLVSKNPELVDCSKLPILELIRLLDYSNGMFLKFVDFGKMSIADRVEIVTRCIHKKVRAKVTFSDINLKNMSQTDYLRLLAVDFGRFIIKEKYLSLNQTNQSTIFLQHTAWVIDNIGVVPPLSSADLATLSASDPELVDRHITDFSKVSTTRHFWDNMIEFDETKYIRLFIENTKTLTSKTMVRSVIWSNPEIIKSLRPNDLISSKLSIKEWILLIDEVTSSHRHSEDLFEDWKLSDEMIEVMRLDLTSEILTGKSKLSTRFQNAMKKILKAEKNED